MTAKPKSDQDHTLFSNISSNLAAGIRALSLYPPEHPETQKKAGDLLKGLTTYLQKQPTLNLVFFKGEVVVKTTPYLSLVRISANLSRAWKP